jgi:hypothetical protein
MAGIWFTATAATWQNFYLLVGTAAATLIGLMFVAITFGSNRVSVKSPSNLNTARAFLDPTLTHFVQVLVTACLIAVPAVSAWLLAAALSTISVARIITLLRTYDHMKEAQRVNGDIERSDWLSGVFVPALAHLGLVSAGGLFAFRNAAAFDMLAIVTIAILLNGIYGAWELVVWLALTRRES